MRFVLQCSSRWPSVSPVVAAFRQLSVCIAASPVRGDIRLPGDQPVSLREIGPRPAPRWIAAWLDPRLPPLRCCALASMLPTERHSCRSGRTAHGNAASYSAWHTSIACVGVLALYLLPGCFPFPACPRAYLYTSPIKAHQSRAPSLQRVVLHAFTGVGSEVARLRAGHRPPLKRYVQFSRIPLSRRLTLPGCNRRNQLDQVH